MNKSIRTALMLITLIAAGMLAGCGVGSTPTVAVATLAPSPDLNALRTEVAATVLAQVPQICALTPSATIQPTATQTRIPVTKTATTPMPSITPGAGTPTVALIDKVQFITQSVADGTQFLPGSEFSLTWRVQNIGNSTWTTGYRLRFFAGEDFDTADQIALGKDVKPGEQVDITVQMKAPNLPGEYIGNWVMSNEQLGNFKDPLFLKIVVPAPTATPTRTPVPTNSATRAVQPSATPTP